VPLNSLSVKDNEVLVNLSVWLYAECKFTEFGVHLLIFMFASDKVCEVWFADDHKRVFKCS
jgi:hypothetical protein